MQVKFKKLDPNAQIPKQAHVGDAGYDLVATSMSWDASMQCYIYGTGLAMEIPYGYVGHVYARSSIRKHNVVLANSVGVIDSCYRGEIMLSFKPTVHNEYPPYAIGDKIGQISIDPVIEIEFEESEHLSKTDRGEGGHGSTGK